MTDAQAIEAIHKLLSGQTWSPDTLDRIAEIIEGQGLAVEPPAQGIGPEGIPFDLP